MNNSGYCSDTQKKKKFETLNFKIMLIRAAKIDYLKAPTLWYCTKRAKEEEKRNSKNNQT